MDAGGQRPGVGKQGLMLLGGQCGDSDLKLPGHMGQCWEARWATCRGAVTMTAVSLSFPPPPPPFFKKMFRPCPTAYGTLVPRPGLKPMPPALEAWSFKPLDRQGNPSVSSFVRWR